MYLLGIDLGSTNLKVAAYNFKGKPVGQFSRNTPIHYTNGAGRAYYNPNELWKITCQGIKSVLSKLKGPGFITSVAVASAGEALVPVNKKGEAIGEAFPWFDERTAELGEWWDKYFKENEIYKITGASPHYKFSLNHLLWIRKNCPSVFDKARMWMSLSDYISYKLSGIAVMNYSIAGTTMMFDLKQHKWSERILSSVGIDIQALPNLVPSGQALGSVCSKAGKETGLHSKTLVVAGGHDHICGALACNVCKEGQVLDSTGTGKATIMVLNNALFDKKAIKSGFDQRCHVVRDKYYIAGSNPNGGAVIDWLAKEIGLYSCIEKYHNKSNINRYSQLSKLASTASPGCKGIFFIPKLRSSNIKEIMRAGFIGIRHFHQRNELIRACFEGMGFEFRNIVDDIESLTGININNIVAIGRCSRDKFFVQVEADISGKIIEIPEAEEAVSLGAAVLGGISAGVYKDEKEAGGAVYRVKYVVKPDKDNTEFYDNLRLNIYSKLSSTLKDINNKINSFFERNKSY